MKYRIEMVILFLTVTNTLVWGLLFIYGTNNINIFSIIALIASVIISFLVYDKNEDKKHKPDEPTPKNPIHSILSYTDTRLTKIRHKYLILSILFSNVLFAILNSYLIMNKINIRSDENAESIISIVKALNVTSIIITQFGGFCIQGILIYLLAVIFGSDKNLNSYLKIVGFSYVGFLILTISSIIVNTIFIQNDIPLSDFKDTFEKSILYGWLGKSGEYLVLILISLGIYNSDKFSFPKSIMLATVPTILLLALKLFFTQLI